jgi:hypothetical protein
VRILDVPEPADAPDGSIATKQMAELTLSRSELDRIWTPEYLERLARTYWRFLTRTFLGLVRVLYTPDTREVVLLGRPLVLLRFRCPEYDVGPDAGSVTWPVEGGLLVARAGRRKGYLRLAVRRPAEQPAGEQATVLVSSEVASFFPMLAFGSRLPQLRWLARVGRAVYRGTQLRVHVLVTNAFFRSLAGLDFATSVVGTLVPGTGDGAVGELTPAPGDADPGALSPPERR